MGAGGRDFHDFNVAFRDDASVEVVAFTAAQIPGIDGRVYPPSLAGPRYPNGIPVRPEEELERLIRDEHVDEVVLAYSDLSHEDVMHKASRVLAAGADFRLLGPNATMLRSAKPVVAVCAVRTGCGKSQTSRRVGSILLARGLRVALVRHPMPYGDLEAMRAQRFASLEDIDRAQPTLEEREEYEPAVRLGMVVHAGVDYADVLARAEEDADVIVWDGGNNDFPFVRPDLLIVVTDPLRAGHELRYHPGETNVRLADVVVVNKIDSASVEQVARVVDDVRTLNPRAPIVHAESPVTLDDGPSLQGRRVVVVEDGPTVTHGEMPFGAGMVAARAAGAFVVDPRPYAVGSIAAAYRTYPHLGDVVPALGYSQEQRDELRLTLDAVPCDAIVSGTPLALTRLIDTAHPVRQASYELREVGSPTLEDALEPLLAQAAARGPRRLWARLPFGSVIRPRAKPTRR